MQRGMNRILMAGDEVDRQGRATLCDRRADHLCEVLDAQPGQSVRVGLLDGPRGRATVLAREGRAVTLACEWEEAPPPRAPVDLLLALPRPKVMKRLWAPLAMLGVDRIMLVRAWKVEKAYFHTHVLDPAFYRPLLVNGLEQAADTLLPRVSIHLRLRPFLEDAFAQHCDAPLRLVADPTAPARLSAMAPPPPGTRAVLAIGPEGGWTLQEMDWLRALRFAPFQAGPRPLRTDIACAGLLTLLHEHLSR